MSNPDPLRLIGELQERNAQLICALDTIARWRTVNIAGEWEGGLRDIIRSITDVAAAALERS